MKKEVIKLDYKQLSVKISLSLFNKIEEVTKGNRFMSNSIIVRDALEIYFKSGEKVFIPHQKIDVSISKIEPVVEEIPEKDRGLIIPELKEKPEIPVIDPEITGTGLRTLERVRRTYVDPALVAKAKRNKDAGRDYDKNMEQYFD